MIEIHHILRQPKVLYLVTIRNAPEMFWASYNFWCNPLYDLDCSPGVWTNIGKNYRSSKLFTELWNAQKLSKSVHFPMIPTCFAVGKVYTRFLDTLANNNMSFATLAIEESETNKTTYFFRLKLKVEHYFEKKVQFSSFAIQNYRVNTGNSRGGNHVTRTPSKNLTKSVYEGPTYEISNFQPLSETTRVEMWKCWEECGYVSSITGYKYDCTTGR